MIKIVENKNLRDHTSMRIGGEAFQIIEIEDDDDVRKAHHLSREEHKPLIILGDGTNTIFRDGRTDYIIGLMRIRGIRVVQDFDNSAIIEVGAGENWDEFIEWSINNKYSGLELMSAIPGTVGATPVQNVGAYGKEVGDLLVNVYAFDRELEKFVTLGLQDCQLEYRNSVFKKEPGRFIIAKVTFELKKTPAEMPIYKDLKLYFLGQESKPSARQIRNAVWEIRSQKLPDPWDHPNCGSFFKNPFVDINLVQKLLKKFPKMPHFQIDENTFKLYAGWLIQNIPWQKLQTKNIKFNQKNKLVLINEGEANFKELKKVIGDIKKQVSSHFGVELEVEPRIYE
jgi:UDP-N-acetylmuramate dehydrogenase